MSLVVCGSPIGNLEDASPRLARTLAEADVVAAEDTRRVRRLAAGLGVRITGRVLSCFEANEAARVPQILAELAQGHTVALVSDAGMPTLSDPGYRLVAATVAAGYQVTVVPGPSAVTSALAVAGLPTDRVAMEGFLPRTPTARRRRLAELAGETRTLVILEAPHRVTATLTDLVSAFGPERGGVLTRELTKTYEEIRRGSLGELLRGVVAAPPRGEITLVVAGAELSAAGREQAGSPLRGAGREPAVLAADVARRRAAGEDHQGALAATARAAGVSRRVVYDAVLAQRPDRDEPDRVEPHRDEPDRDEKQ